MSGLKLSTKAAKIIQNFGSMKELEDVYIKLLKTGSGLQAQTDDLLEFIEENKYQITKDAAKSTLQRQESNRMYVNSKTPKDVLEALRVNNECISFAPNNSEELALAYGNRAMILFRLNCFQECLTDITRALCLNYPEKSVGRLLVKRVRCMKILKHPDFYVTYKDSLDWVDEHLDDGFEMKEEIRSAFEDPLPSGCSQMMTQFQDELLEKMKTTCPDLEKVQIGKNSRGERALVAARDIKIGETVAVEKIYTNVFHMENGYLTCWQCLMMCLNPIPCEGCIAATYCSESCKAEAWSKHHELECSCLNTVQPLLEEGIVASKICLLGMREYGGILPLMKEVYKMSNVEDVKKECTIENGKYPSDSYRSIFFMMTNKYSIEKKNFVEEAARVGMIVYHLATRTNFFGQKYQGRMVTVLQERMPKFFATLIFRHYIMLLHAPKRAKILPNNVHVDLTTVGPLFHIVDHSCNPNTARLLLKNYQFLVAVDNIKKGEALTFSHYRQALIGLTKQQRTRVLKDILLRPCSCEVCTKNLPHDLPNASDLMPEDKLDELAIYLFRIGEVFGKLQDVKPKTAPEFFEQMTEVFGVLKPYFDKGPAICQEIIMCKNYLLQAYYQLHNTMYTFLDSEV